jgi:uncharacterized heparinase superfamily protein
MSPATLRLYWETARHLKPTQVLGRLRVRCIRPMPDVRPAPGVRAQTGSWVAPVRRPSSRTGKEEFRFLNERASIASYGWDNPALSKLWRYNLHYFDDLNAEGASDRTAWHLASMLRWIADNPPGQGTGWEPYPTSLRIVNWIKWALTGNRLDKSMLESLAVQVRWLTRRLEYHLLGNHLFANAKALIFAGAFFFGDEAESWFARGASILNRQLPEQILADGGQFELSPMYHALALEDMCDVINVLRSASLPVPESWKQKIAPMRSWLAAMCHPDGEISFFNDAAFGVAPSPAELEAYAGRLRLTAPERDCYAVRHLPDSGYIRVARDDAVAILDVARVGPDYIPGHAHADTLSFELSVFGHRALVNSGTSLYGDGAERQRQRGTGAHNTVAIGEEDSSEVWAGFRVARRARPLDLSTVRDGDDIVVSCAHDGYARLPGRPQHTRTWRFTDHALTVRDIVSAPSVHALAAFHFHPALTPRAGSDYATGSASVPAGGELHWRVVHGRARLEAATWHPEFGLSVPTHRLIVELIGGESCIEWAWQPH